VKEGGELRLGVARGERQDPAAHRLAADAALGVLAHAAFQADVGAAQQPGLAGDDAGLAVVEPRDEHHRRRQAHHQRAVGLAADVALAQLREVDAGDHVARGEEGELIAGDGVGDQFVRLRDGADVHHVHRRRLQPAEVADARDDGGERHDLLAPRGQRFDAAGGVAPDQPRDGAENQQCRDRDREP